MGELLFSETTEKPKRYKVFAAISAVFMQYLLHRKKTGGTKCKNLPKYCRTSFRAI